MLYILNPCQICGNTPYFGKNKIFCDICGLELRMQPFDTAEDMIKAWNRISRQDIVTAVNKAFDRRNSNAEW